MSQEPQQPTEQEKRYTIENVKEGDEIVRVVKTANGNNLFTLPNTFADDQVDTVFNLVNVSFARGCAIGEAQLQNNMLRLLGIQTQSKSEPGATQDTGPEVDDEAESVAEPSEN